MKVTKEQIQSKIKSEMYMVLPDGRSTLCILTLANGYTIKGLSACVDESEFDLNIGRKVSYENAVEQIWPLEGYLLAERIFCERLIPEVSGITKAVMVDMSAPYGYRKDGMPKKRPGRPVK